MDAVLHVVRNLGAPRLAIMAGATAALVGVFIWVLSRLAQPEYALLYGDLDMADSAAIVQKLEADGTPYELHDGGRSVRVPADRVPRTRLKLADEGLPSGGSVGYELFDSTESFGTTNFMQNVNLVRALEGELARTIRSIDGVQGSRVHLVLPKRELFSRQREEPSASVVLQMRGSSRLGQAQVLAIRHLVASAVPGLTPARISVVDDKGTLLAGGFEDVDAGTALNQKAEQHRLGFESRLARTVEGLLERTVGPGKARAEVYADMDFDRINTSEEIFDPDGQVVRSTQSIEERASSKEGAVNPPVSVATNLPDAQLATADGENAEASENRTEETVNYEISKKVINHVREAGIVRRLSVAVLIDGTYGPGDDGALTYRPRSQEELNLLATLVRGAIGFNAERGDTVEVINMRFAEPALGEQEPLELFFGLTKNDLLQLAQYLVLIVFALLVILLVVRPLLTRALEAMPVPATGPAGELFGGQGATPAIAGPSSSGLPAIGDAAPGDGELEEMIDLERVEGRVRASAVKKVGEIIDKHPDEALAIIRTWLHDEG